MQDRPDPDAILASVAAWLRGAAAPALPAHAGFEAKVAAGAIDLVRRQIAAAGAEAAEAARLSAFLGRDGDLADLTRELCARIEAGEADLTTPDLAALLIAATADKLSVDQPDRASARRLCDLAKGG